MVTVLWAGQKMAILLPKGLSTVVWGQTKFMAVRSLETHTRACIDAGIMIYGINAEVMPAQWEFQIGYRGIDGESADALNTADHIWFARWLLFRIGEEYGVEAMLHANPSREIGTAVDSIRTSQPSPCGMLALGCRPLKTISSC